MFSFRVVSAEEMLILETLETDDLIEFASEQGVDIMKIIHQAIGGELSIEDSCRLLAEQARDGVIGDWKGKGMMLLMPPLAVGLLKLATAEGGGIRKAAFLVCRVSGIAALADVFVSMRSIAENLLELISGCTDVLAPVMVSVVSLSGAETTALFLTPMTGVCVNIIQHVLERWGITIASAAAGIAISGNLSSSVRLNRLYNLCKRIVRMGAGGTLAIFIMILSMQGRISSGRDGFAFRTARVAAENFIPVVGGNISDSLESLLSTVHMIKDALGIGACVLILFICFVPMVRLLLASLFLHLCAAVSEPMKDDVLTDMLEQMGGAVEMLLVVALTAGVLCCLLIGSCISAASNVIL